MILKYENPIVLILHTLRISFEMELGNRFDKILSEIYLVDNIVYIS